MSFRQITAPKLEFKYAAGFKTDTVSDITTDLTDPITCRPGTWILFARTPPVRIADASHAMDQTILDFYGVDNAEYIFGPGVQTTRQYGTAIAFVKLTETRTIKLRSGTGQTTYIWRDNTLSRGGIFAVRIGD